MGFSDVTFDEVSILLTERSGELLEIVDRALFQLGKPGESGT